VNGSGVVGFAGGANFNGGTVNFDGATVTNIPQSAITSLTTDLGLKAPKASPSFTGTVSFASASSVGFAAGSISQAAVNGLTTDLGNKAPKASPLFTGSVGIGTTNPQATLDVSGSTKLGSASTAISGIQFGISVTDSRHSDNANIRTKYIGFATPITSIPKVIVTLEYGGVGYNFTALVHGIGTNGFNVNIIPSAGFGVDIYFHWIAIA
jgi:hypothetical protein